MKNKIYAQVDTNIFKNNVRFSEAVLNLDNLSDYKSIEDIIDS